MVFAILAGLLVVLVVAVCIFESIGDGIAALFGGALLGMLIIFFFVAGTNPSGDSEVVNTTVDTYTLSEGSDLTVGTSELEYIYVEDGKPVSGETRHDSLVISGTETLEVTTTYYEHGKAIFPWGFGDVKLDVVVK